MMKKLNKNELAGAIEKLKNVSIGDTKLIYLDLPRGAYKGFYYVIAPMKKTESKENTVKQLRAQNYAVCDLDFDAHIKELLKEYLRGKKHNS